MRKQVIAASTFLACGLMLSALTACNSSTQIKPDDPNKTDLLNNPEAKANPKVWPKVTSNVKRDEALEKKVAKILSGMTVEQKVAQLIQPEIRSFTFEDMKKYGFGTFLNGGGAFPNNDKNSTIPDWVDFADDMYDASVDDSVDGSTIPTMWGTDAVHGHNNIIGATIFPHNIGLGAARNPELVRRIGQATATEVLATGIDWVFAPTLAVARDDRWGRTYEAYSEDPELVKLYSNYMVEGLQGAGEDFLSNKRVVATAKHFLGDGGTHEGDDQGNAIVSEEELRDIHGAGYVGAIEAGVQTVMASFNSWNGKKMHGSHSLLTQVLKEQMGFDGFVIGDWNGHGQLAGCSNEDCARAINAGVDAIMVPDDWKKMYENTLRQVKAGEIKMSRVDDAVTRILRVKMRAGIFDRKPSQRPAAKRTELIGAAPHRELAREAVRESLVLLKNKNGVLPLSRNMNVLVAGDAADHVGKVSGGWSVTWQGTGTSNKDFPGSTSIFKGIEGVVSSAGGKATLSVDGSFTAKPDVAVVVFGENPYAEGEGDLKFIEFQRSTKKDLKLLQKLKAQGIPVVSIFISGRPLWVNREINASDAFVAAWLPGTEGHGLADVIFKKANGKVNYDFKGKLSFSWPKTDVQYVLNRNDKDYDPLFPYGYGLTYKDKDTLGDNLSEKRYVSASSLLDGLSSDMSVMAPGYIFKSRALDGFNLMVGDAVNWSQPVDASVFKSLGGVVSVKAVNWKIQEDSREVKFSGTGAGNIYFAAATPKNFIPVAKQGAVISLDIQVAKAPTSDVTARMDCGYPCTGRVPMKEQLSNMKPGAWRNVSIDVMCFAEAGAKLGEITNVFFLETDGELDFTFANVQLELGKAGEADIACSN